MQIFEYDHYKPYLKDWMKTQPRRGHGETQRLAEAIGVHPTLVSQVLRGDKELTLEQGMLAAEYLSLTEFETEYLLALIQLARSGNTALQKHFKKRLLAMKQDSLKVAKRIKKDRELNDVQKAQFYSDWIYSAIRLQTSIEGFKSVDKLAERFDLPRANVVAIAEFLQDAGLIEASAKGLQLGSQRTHLDPSSPFLRQHHTNWRLQALNRAPNLSEQELMFTAPMSVSHQDFLSIRGDLMDLIKTVFKIATDSKAETVACLNFDWFQVAPASR
jgi:uncharacterized protein (TIGR02147 family)